MHLTVLAVEGRECFQVFGIGCSDRDGLSQLGGGVEVFIYWLEEFAFGGWRFVMAFVMVVAGRWSCGWLRDRGGLLMLVHSEGTTSILVSLQVVMRIRKRTYLRLLRS